MEATPLHPPARRWNSPLPPFPPDEPPSNYFETKKTNFVYFFLQNLFPFIRMCVCVLVCVCACVCVSPFAFSSFLLVERERESTRPVKFFFFLNFQMKID